MCNLTYSILCFPASVLVLEAFAVLGSLKFYGTFTLHLNWTETVTCLSLEKIKVEKNVVSDLGREQRGREKRRFGTSALKVGYHLYQTCHRLSVICIYGNEKWIHAASNPKFAIHIPLYSFWMVINNYQIYQAHKGWHFITGACCPGGGAIRKQALIKAEAISWEGTAFQGKL